MQPWLWQNLRVELPEQWEMLQFSRNPESGRCGFADRYGFRFELHWRQVAAPPDFDRMMSDYLARLKSAENVTDARRVRRYGCEGIESRAESLLTTRFGLHFPDESCVVEAVFIWPLKPVREPAKVLLTWRARLTRPCSSGEKC